MLLEEMCYFYISLVYLGSNSELLLRKDSHPPSFKNTSCFGLKATPKVNILKPVIQGNILFQCHSKYIPILL